MLHIECKILILKNKERSFVFVKYDQATTQDLIMGSCDPSNLSSTTFQEKLDAEKRCFLVLVWSLQVITKFKPD